MTWGIGARAGGDRWCILRTAGPRTLQLMKALTGAGFEAWTPSRTVKRDAPGKRRRIVMGQTRLMVEVTMPILPGFVFARASRLNDLFRLSETIDSPLPRFRVFTHAGRAPEIRDADVTGLRVAEADALAAITAKREAEGRAAARRERAERLGTERARRRALRQETKTLASGDDVTVADMPALAGLIGRVVEGRGTSAVIHFGGSLIMTVEAWRVQPHHVSTASAITGAAA